MNNMAKTNQKSSESDLMSLAMLARTDNRDALIQTLDHLAETLGEGKLVERLTSQLLPFVPLESVIPPELQRYAPLIRDGLTMLLKKTPYNRFKQVILQQILLPPNCHAVQRIRDLARYYPTLQKMAQIIARRPGLGVKVKKWLISLEEERGVALNSIQKKGVLRFLQKCYPDSLIKIDDNVLASASVADVVLYSVSDFTRNKEERGVVKILKNNISTILADELDILAKIFSWFSANKRKYNLDTAHLASIYDNLREDMQKEVDLQAEQKNLIAAGQVYSRSAISIPALLSCSSPAMTAMEFAVGCRVTEFIGSTEERAALASLLFENIICQPLFSLQESSLFHGDPHAGNILVNSESPAGIPKIWLVDWTLAGYLPRKLKIELVQLLVGIITLDHARISKTIANISNSDITSAASTDPNIIEEFLTSSDHFNNNPLDTTFSLLQKLTLAGEVFPAELILFRKAFYTLEGVLFDLAPGFASQKVLERILLQHLVHEFPERIEHLLIIANDKAENYSTMLTNSDLLQLSSHQLAMAFHRAATIQNQLLEAQMKIAGDFYRLMLGK